MEGNSKSKRSQRGTLTNKKPKTANPRFAYDSYRRFIQMYSDVVMEVPKSFFEKIIDEVKEAKGVHYDTELTVDDLKELVKRFKEVYKNAMNGEEYVHSSLVLTQENHCRLKIAASRAHTSMSNLLNQILESNEIIKAVE